ncbi:MAG: gamma-glutamyl kinase [Pseudotabrizicola sp.]|uniref:gamma-glutamyl kinase n=1 Tax=Pseudotabrizicola sp. TaxID=2939647 RepID=UPI0027189DB8|nr:gamma-glutamyl kinase [Pseudotabrizicola sp.]MDO8881726.1 gamma-glutamyl kinase [Pseudotabrizicola sp.]MDP2080401.1 gamma-glutamyl kinase [Pseudotabrizicola sp.]MDZ7573755.1 gamma-glutamyl kinase [Pseudotabrizicola sp.]
MLVLEKARLVFLANPKTATQSLRAVLAPFAQATPSDTGHKHINAQIYHRKWAARIRRNLGGPVETFSVMRAPMDHLGSWYRYRQRDALRGHENSTHGLSFAEFVEARLADDPPPFARIGRQDRFLGFLNGGTPVNYIFDYADLDRLLAFLSARLGSSLELPHRNASPIADAQTLILPDALSARLSSAHATEFALYDRVRKGGLLHTPAAPGGAVA